MRKDKNHLEYFQNFQSTYLLIDKASGDNYNQKWDSGLIFIVSGYLIHTLENCIELW